MSSKPSTSSTPNANDQSSATSIAIEPPPLPTPHSAQSPENFAKALNTFATTFAIAAPILLLLPPRKLDLYTFSLTTGFVVSANHLLITHTGRGIWQRLDRKKKDVEERRNWMYVLPTDKSLETSDQFQKQNELKASGEVLGADGKAMAAESKIVAAAREAAVARQAEEAAQAEEGRRVEKEGKEEDEEEATGVKGILMKIWMGDETEGWQARRMQEEREKLAAGKTHWDLIMDQIWEIWEKKKEKEGVVEKEEEKEKEKKDE